MEPHQSSARILGAEAILHHLSPNLAGSTILCDFLEEVVVRVEEKAEPGTEFVYVESATECPLNVFHAVVEGEGQFLQRGRAGFANVITADRDRIEARRELRSELKGVDDQPHGGSRWIDIFFLRDVFLQNIVLNRARNLFPVRTLLFGDDQIHSP